MLSQDSKRPSIHRRTTYRMSDLGKGLRPYHVTYLYSQIKQPNRASTKAARYLGQGRQMGVQVE
jgi:hypothetical protein